MDAIADGTMTKVQIGNRAHEIQAEIDRLTRELENAREIPDDIILHPLALGRYERMMRDLAGEIQRGIDRGDSAGAKALRDLIDSVTVYRDESSKRGLRVTIQGKLNTLVGIQGFGPKSDLSNGSGGPLPTIPPRCSLCVSAGGVKTNGPANC